MARKCGSLEPDAITKKSVTEESLRTSSTMMSSAFLLSAHSRQSRASLFESIGGKSEAAALKDKGDSCRSLRPPGAAQAGQSATPPSPVREFATTKRRTESPSASVRERLAETIRAAGPDAEWRRTRRVARVALPPAIWAASLHCPRR